MEPIYSLETAPDELKYRFKFLFGDLSHNDLLKIRMDKTSTYSVSDYQTAKEITKIILKIHGINKNSIIVDGTSCVGGNVISFAKTFKHVYAIEFDKSRSKLLQNNIDVYKLSKKVTVYNGDATKLYLDLPKVDIWFLDPPWGGLDYKKNKQLDLYLSGINISDFCIMLKDCANYIVLKLPKNFSIDNLKKVLDKQNKKKRHVELSKVHNLKKMLILVLKIKTPQSNMLHYFKV